jgi:predicted transglutaminase-like cysteine proteinase
MTKISWVSALIAGSFIVAQTTASGAFPVNPKLFARPAPAESAPGAWLLDGDFVLAPMRSIRFCINYPDECKSHGQSGIVQLDDTAWEELNKVNREINAKIAPAYATAGERDWSITTSYGDCNDYAIQKRHQLLARGWPSSALSLAVVVIPSGEGHLVLTVRTDRGDLVLDNLRYGISAWNRTGYRFVKRQSNTSPKYWVETRGRGAKPDVQLVDLRTPPQPAREEAAVVRDAATSREDEAMLVSMSAALNVETPSYSSDQTW